MKPSSQRLVRTKAFAQPQILAQKLKTIYSFVSTPDVMHCAVVVEAGSVAVVRTGLPPRTRDEFERCCSRPQRLIAVST